MIIPEIEYTLKDGRKALIRSPRDEDIPGGRIFNSKFDLFQNIRACHETTSIRCK